MSDDFTTRIPAAERGSCTLIQRCYYTSTPQQRALLFTPSFAGHYVCRTSFAIDRTLEDTSLLLLTTAGEGEVTCRGHTVRLSAGSVMLIDGREHHRYHAVGDGWEFRFIHFSGAMSQEYTEAVIAQSGMASRPTTPVFLELLGCVEQVIALMQSPPLSAGVLLSREIYAILTGLLTDTRRDESITDAQLAAISTAVKRIKAHFHEPLSVSELAESCYLSRPYFSRIFRQVCGVPPHEYILLCRINQAKQLLTETSASIASIGEKVGFSDAAVFTRAFRRCCGMTPAEFRRMK